MGKYTLPEMPYAYDALEPHIDARTMEIHHTKHHQKYTDAFNETFGSVQESKHPLLMGKSNPEGGYDEVKVPSLEYLLEHLGQAYPNDEDNPEYRKLNFNGGGYDNHKLFWTSMKPNGGGEPGGALADAINASFGSFADFKEQFSSKTAPIQGSGWGWLVYNPLDDKVEYLATQNQDSPKTYGDGTGESFLTPLLGLDVWEHAYYLKYQNKRPDYIAAWWNVVNWEEVDNRLSKAK